MNKRLHALLTILSPAPVESDVAVGPSIADLADALVGIGNGTHTALSTHQAHLDDFGR